MKKSLMMIGVALAASVMIAGCGKTKDSSATNTTPTHEPIGVIEEDDSRNDIAESELSNEEPVAEALPEVPEESEEKPEDISDDVKSEDSSDSSNATAEDNTADTESVKEPANPNAQPIVWLGDSLTQGSLGDNNDNLPGAPYETLKKLVNVPVEGYGLYGYNTHDIFWVYMDSSQYNQTIDPKKTYIFWVGSNDWVVEGVTNSDTAPVIAEIDRFLSLEGPVNNYIVIGTTARYELGDMYKKINGDLLAKYGSHYLDVIDVIGKDGYGPDKIHLTQGGYDAVARAVYDKLRSLGYI